MNNLALRREILLAPLAASFGLAIAEQASASPLNPAETIIRLPAPAAMAIKYCVLGAERG